MVSNIMLHPSVASIEITSLWVCCGSSGWHAYVGLIASHPNSEAMCSEEEESGLTRLGTKAFCYLNPNPKYYHMSWLKGAWLSSLLVPWSVLCVSGARLAGALTADCHTIIHWPLWDLWHHEDPYKWHKCESFMKIIDIKMKRNWLPQWCCTSWRWSSCPLFFLQLFNEMN